MEEKVNNNLREEVEELRETVNNLLYEIEASNRDSRVTPDAKKGLKRTKKAKKPRPIKPPWERAGYETKEEWMENR